MVGAVLMVSEDSVIGRRKIAAENKMLRERLEECQVLLSALALESDGEFTVPADAFVKFSLAIDNEHAFVIARNDDGSVIVRFQPTAPASDVVVDETHVSA